MRTVNNALLAAPVAQSWEIRIVFWNKDNEIDFADFGSISDFIRNGADFKNLQCKFIEDKVDLFGKHLIVVYTK